MQIRKFFLFFSILALLNIFSSCDVKEEKIIIAISKAKPIEFYGQYTKWVHKANSKVEIINMYELGLDSALKVLNICDGLLVTGGADVYPGWYGKLSDTARCGSFDFYRDTLEMKLIAKAIEMKMPVVGICRGEQIINVSLGGSLIIDIPTNYDTIIKHRLIDWKNCFHQVNITKNSLLDRICKPDDFTTNSNHHQAIDRISDQLVAVASTKDGIIEAVEWKEPNNKSFLIAVQWHPERLDSVNASLSLPIAREFLFQASQYHDQK